LKFGGSITEPEKLGKFEKEVKELFAQHLDISTIRNVIHCLLVKDALTSIQDHSDKELASSWKRFVDRLNSGVQE